MKVCLLAAFALVSGLAVHADEGMWLFNQPPRELLRSRYQFEITDAWLDHLQKSSVRVGGASGSFVSEDGLLISNDHVGADSLQKLSTKEKNYLHDGFYARTPTEEMKCLDLELNVLQSIEDVTARVNSGVPKDASPDIEAAARRKVIAEIEKESLDQTGLHSTVVTLWQGGAYQLYRYKRYTDVRLVFAPEQQAAFFGGDPDNFEFPRYDLDICLFRVYENGQPVKVKDYLKFSPAGPSEGSLVFVSGHPGATSRLLTMAELDYLRDQGQPFSLSTLKRREVLFTSWSARNLENARRAHQLLFGTQNGRKAIDGRLAGLLDPDLMGTKAKAEADFKARLAARPEFATALAAYDKIAGATKILAAQATRAMLLEAGQGFSCESFRLARTLLRAGDERPKPNGERLREFSDANRATQELALFSAKPIYTDLETLQLSDSLTFFATQLGGDDPLVQRVLAGKSPHERAVELIKGTRVRDVAFRKALYEGGASAVSSAKDPMIELARLVDTDARALRKVTEAQAEVKQQAYAAIARARNELLGTDHYPDATGTLRLSIGVVKGYEEDGRAVPAFTTIGGLYAKAAGMKNQAPFDLAPAWSNQASKPGQNTPLNFVSTCDIIGGNSGSPVVNRNGEFVGIIFDGNLQSLPWDYAFSDNQGRAIAVDSAAILEALDQVYDAKALRLELLNGRRNQ
ncbi:MAG TPA: S46 family peptidase [Candidatus Acidoferrales bacterium]|nr:S46 family peptidase [Candidatus Acidoferrales bacterium]